MKLVLGCYKKNVAAACILQGIALLSIPLPFFADSLSAQPITTATDGTNTVVLQNGQRFDITGGTQAGENLFHSFQQFGLNQGQIANFLSQPNIQNILSRVVGGNPSVINGLIQLTGGNSNLYIMNPAGIIFGANASLNVPAAFTATTASGIQVGNGWFGINTSTNDLKNLTGSPNAFAFTNSTDSTDSLSMTERTGVILNQGNLSVPQGQSITLVGGIVVNTGTITTPNGKINIIAVPDGKYVRITPVGGVLSLDLPIAAQQELGATPPLTAVDLPKLLTGSGIITPTKAGDAIASGTLNVSGDQGGNIQILGDRINLASANINASGLNGGGTVLIGGNYQGTGTTPKAQTTTVDANSVINVDALMNGNGGLAIVWSDGKTIFDGTITAKGGTQSGNGGLIETSGKNDLVVGNTARVNTSAFQGETGTWLLDPTTITVVASGGIDATVAAANANPVASTIDSATIVAALNGANVNLIASNAITVDAAIDTATPNFTGALILSAPTANLNAPITLRAGIPLTGTATTVNVGAGGRVQNGVDVAVAGATVNLAAATYTLTNTVTIDKNLTLNGASLPSSTVSGNNAVRVFTITGGSNVNMNNLTVINGNHPISGGGILVTGGSTLNLSNSTFTGNNTPGFGGALRNELGNTINISNSTFFGNTAGINGGALNNQGGTYTVNSSTFFGNTAGFGGAINNFLGTMSLSNSIVIGNNSPNGQEISTGIGGSTLTFTGPNIIGINGVSGISGIGTVGGVTPITPTGAASTVISTTLANNGGPTQTFALVSGSPAINAGSNAGVAATDQRGLPRIFGDRVDIGSFESQPTLIFPEVLRSSTENGFAGVYPSREDVNGRIPRLNEQDLADFSEILCFDSSIVNLQNPSIPVCKEYRRCCSIDEIEKSWK
ncbi:choice-of-anchor Q domain-containing protein [Pseudanabaena minima]|uniref:two-partner secretion domain-containing protein n=1 Tax=Pseudanabaena minima TaxID=890415 RepID=UPI003DA80DF5